MRTLYLMRHAKSSWTDGTLSDHERPLAPRGRSTAPAVAAWMLREGMIPQSVLCSTAARARETWSLMGALLAPEASLELSEEVYLGDAAQLLDKVRGAGDDADRLLLLGHNPALEDLATALAGEGAPAELARLRKKFPTAAVAEIRFPVESWRHVALGRGRLERFCRPKDLRDTGGAEV